MRGELRFLRHCAMRIAASVCRVLWWMDVAVDSAMDKAEEVARRRVRVMAKKIERRRNAAQARALRVGAESAKKAKKQAVKLAGGAKKKVRAAVAKGRLKVKPMDIKEMREKYATDMRVNLALDEISRCAAALNVNVSRWKITKLFAPEEGSAEAAADLPIITDPVRIAQIVAEKSKRPVVPSVAGPDDVPAIADELVRGIHALMTKVTHKRVSDTKARIEDNIAYAMQAANASLEQMWANIKNLATETDKLAALENTTPDVDYTPTRTELERIYRAGFWADMKLDGANVWFRTANPLVVSEVNTKAGIDRHVNLGYFAVRITPSSGSAIAVACGGNKVSSHRASIQIHPHIWDGGRICLGNTESVNYSNSVRARSLTGMLSAIQAALSGYNNADTYAPLATFETGKTYSDLITLGKVAWASPYADVTAQATAAPGATTGVAGGETPTTAPAMAEGPARPRV